jgi:hypothetical protein
LKLVDSVKTVARRNLLRIILFFMVHLLRKEATEGTQLAGLASYAGMCRLVRIGP